MRAEQYTKSIEKKRLAEAERYKGNEFMKSKEFDEAIASYTRAIADDPKEPAAFSNRALAYLRQKKYTQCIEDSN
jgi:small glutamine-rich tetratricopeptide repeat-containing protein alpha